MALTKRQQRFVEEYVKDANGTQAAIRAGFSANGAHVQANRMLRNATVAAEIATLREPVAEAAQITLAAHLNELGKLRDLAKKLNQMGPAITAEVSRGKAAGLYVERSMVETRQLPQIIVE